MISRFLIEQPAVPRSVELLTHWRWLVPSDYELLFATALGDAFLMNKLGAIHFLDVSAGAITDVTSTQAALDEILSHHEHQVKYLFPDFVAYLETEIGPLAQGQCFSPVVPATLGGAFEATNYRISSLLDHFAGFGKLQCQIIPLPLGTEIVAVRPENDAGDA